MLRIFFAGLPRFLLFLLAIVPVLIGAMILTAMQSGQINELTLPADIVRRASYSWALTGHIIGGSTMLLLGLLQFSPYIRRRFPLWHRWSGRTIVTAGAFFALSGLWMNASVTAQDDSWLYDTAQNTVAFVLLGTLFLGVTAIRRGDVARHRVWMLRVYAITLGTATQTVLLLPVFLITGNAEGILLDLVFISGWLVNLAFVELIIRKGRRPSRTRRTMTV